MSNDIFIKSKAIPSNPRSKNYPAGTSIVRSGGGTTTITGGGGTSVDILKVDDVRSLTDRNVFSSLRTLAEILSRIIKKDDTDTELSDENTLSSLRVKAAIDALKDEYISKTAPDETEYLLKTLGGLIVNNGLDVTGGISTDTLTAETITTQLLNVLNKLSAKSGTFSEDLTVSNKATTLNLLVQELADTYDLTVSHVATLMGTIVKEYISSESFVSGLSGEGMKIYKALNGDWNMEIDNLTVRKIFSVFELIVQKITHQGGMVIHSAAGAKLTKVTDGGSYWKCEHDSTDDFVKDDQIICQAFTGTSTKRYWRLVTSSGAGYFNLSKTDCEEGSATPEAEDEVAVLGNRTVSSRQKAQIDCAVGDTAPYRDDYDGINSYSLAGKLITRTGNLSGITDAVFGVLSGSGLYGTNVYLKGTFILKSGKKIEEAIADVENNLSTRITTVETSFEIREGQISSKVTEATTAATNAKKSETNASGSATTASTKAGEAASSATNAGNSASSASGSAGTASAKAGEASTSATNAKNSATSASGSAGTATAKAGEAASSATNAKKSADDAAAKLVTITEKESSINQTASGITLQVKEVQTKASEAATSATNAGNSASTASSKATAAGNSATAAAGSATNAKNSADASAVVLQTVSTKQGEINAKADQITLKVTEVTEKTTQATNAAELATAMSKGRMLYRDPTFESGLNGTYNYALVGTRTIEAITGCPNRLAKGMKITATGWASATDLRVGGFYFGNQSRANAVFVVRIIALIPTGRNIQNYHNSYGTGSVTKWLTSQAGTGKWEEYVYKMTCGSSGTFSTINHFALTGGTAPTASAPVVWYVAYATVFDVTDAEVDYIADAAGKYTTKIVYESGIKALSNSIELKVAKTDFNALGSRVSSAESSITAQAGQIQSKASQTTVNALTGRMETAESSITQNTRQISLKVSANEAGSIADGKVNALKGDLQATGIDIANRKVTVTADTFRVQDNYGNAIAVFKTDATGKPVIIASNIDTKNLVVESGARIGGFKVNGSSLENVNNRDCWINMDYTNGSSRRTSTLGNGFSGIAGFDTAGYFRATGPNENRALILNASGSNAYEWDGGKVNHAINALGGCKWDVNAGDHWSMPGLLGIIRFLCTYSNYTYNYSIQRIWGNGIPSVTVKKFSIPDMFVQIGMEMGSSWYSLTGQTVGPGPKSGIWDSTFVIEELNTHGFFFSCWRNGEKFFPRQADIFIFGNPVK